MINVYCFPNPGLGFSRVPSFWVFPRYSGNVSRSVVSGLLDLQVFGYLFLLKVSKVPKT